MKAIITITILFLFLAPTSAFSFTQCTRPVKDIWTQLLNNGTSDSEHVWISFSDGGQPIYKTQSEISEGQMARFFSMALTAQASGKNLVVRYPEDDLTCPPTGEARNDFLGMWIIGD